MYVNFSIKIVKADHENNEYVFDIVDSASFELNRNYSAQENSDFTSFFVKDNVRGEIKIKGQTKRCIHKKRLMFLDYCDIFYPTDNIFSFKSLDSKIPLRIGNVLFVQTNLIDNSRT